MQFLLKKSIMDIQDFIRDFAEQFDDAELNEFTPETNFKNLDEWSSLTALSVIAMVDENYSVRLKADDFKHSKSISNLFDLIKTRTN